MHRPSLNHVFRVVWNAAKGCWMAVAENCPGRSKSSIASSGASGGVSIHRTLPAFGLLVIAVTSHRRS